MNHTVKIVTIYRLSRGLKDEIIDALPLAKLAIQTLSDLNGLIRTCGIDLERGLAIHPVVGAAKAGPLRGDHADVTGCKGLAEGA
jgi:hypothetical protein